MKILHINSYYKSSFFYKNLYDLQVKNGNDIKVFVPSDDTLNSTARYGSYTMIRRSFNTFDRYSFFIKHLKIYRDIVNTIDVDNLQISHAHSLFSNGLLSMMLKKKYCIPYVVAVRNTDVNLFFKKILVLRKLGLKILNNADRIIFISYPYKDEVITNYVPMSMKKRILTKSIVIPNGIDQYWLNNTFYRKNTLDTAMIKILHVGDIDVNKNIITTLNAVNILRSNGFNVNFNVVGKIKDRSTFEKLSKYKFVTYLGIKNVNDLKEIYRENDIFILPSINETFGLVYAEAMSQGLPIIYSKGQGFDGHFPQGKVGYSVESDNSEDIYKKVISIIENYYSISRNATDEVNKFNWNLINKKYSNIYKNIVEFSA